MKLGKTKIILGKGQQHLEEMRVRRVDMQNKQKAKYTPDVVLYKNGPQYWAELVKYKDGLHIEDLRKVKQRGMKP
jgi:hypothetical protein